MPSRTTSNTSPLELVFHRKPDFSFLRVFGCECYPHLRSYNKHKTDVRPTPSIFLGYGTSHHGYQCFDTLSNKLYITRHVRFNAQIFPFQTQSSSSPLILPADPYISSYPTPVPLVFPHSPPPSPTPPTAAPYTHPTLLTYGHTLTNPNRTHHTLYTTHGPSISSPRLRTYHRRPKQPTSTTPQTNNQPPPHPRPLNLRQNPKQT